ncbi:hypothetical protein MauCBS54593_003324 [Microsporum audouinii]
MHFSYSSLFLSLLALSSGALSASSSKLKVVLPSSLETRKLPPSTFATLTTIGQPNGPLKAPLSSLSTFVFDDISLSTATGDSSAPISYLLDIHSQSHVFAPYRIDVSPETGKILGAWETHRGFPWDNKGANKIISDTGHESGVIVVEAKVLAKKDYYEQREKFSPLSLLKNPMLLLAVFALAVTVGMPYLIENMDPETREEFEKQRAAKKTSAANPAAGFDLAGWMAGTNPNLIESNRPAASSGREQDSAAAQVLPEDEDEIKAVRRYVDQLGPDVHSLEIDSNGDPIDTSSEDPTIEVRYPEYSGALEKGEVARRSELTEIDRFHVCTDLVEYRGSLQGNKQVVAFKYTIIQQRVNATWDERYILKALKGHDSFVQFHRVVVDDVSGKVLGFTSQFISGGTLEHYKDYNQPFHFRWMEQFTTAVDDLSLMFGIMHQDIAPRNILYEPATKSLRL